MTLLAPWALWLFVLGGAVVALYLLKIKRRQATVPALEFWLQLAGQTKVHSLWQRLKRLLSMLLWLVIVACLVLAVGNPLISMGSIKPRAIAVVIDNSASMQTQEADGNEREGAAGVTRLDLARRALEELTTRRPVTDEWLLIEAAREPRVLEPWTYEGKAVRAAAGTMAPFAGSGDLAGAVELAGQLLSGKPDPCIVVISDGGAGALESLAKADARVVPWVVGKATDNLGIGRLAVRASRQQGNYQALVSVVSASDEKIDTQLVLELDGGTHSVELVSIEPHGTWEKTIVIEPPAGGAGMSASGAVLRVSIDRPDALTLDNEAYAVLEPIRPAVVWLVSPPERAFFFEQALGSMDVLVWAEESLTLSPEQYELTLASLKSPAAAAPDGPVPRPESDADAPRSSLKPPDVVVFNGAAPAVLPAAGRFVFVGAWPAQIPAKVTGELESPQLVLAPKPHPLTQHVTLQGSRLAKARKVTLTEPATVLASSPEGNPLIMLFQQPDRQSLCLAFDVLESDLPFRNAFPLLLRNAVAFMHTDAPAWLREQYKIGEPVQPVRALPANVASVKLASTRGGKTQTADVPVKGGRFTLPGLGQAGAIRVSFAGATAAATVNHDDPDESRIGPLTSGDDPAQRLQLSGRLLGTMPWTALVMLATAAVVLEWLTYHFRWTE